MAIFEESFSYGFCYQFCIHPSGHTFMVIEVAPLMLVLTDKNIKDSRDAFNTGMDAGLNFFDTAGNVSTSAYYF